jgi:AraC-like DNA-binding protein
VTGPSRATSRTEGRQRVGVLAEVPDVIRRLGSDPTGVLDLAGVDNSVLADPENSLSFPQVGRLLEAAAAATGREDFALVLTALAGTRSLGLVGALIRSAPTLSAALVDLCVNQQRYVRGATPYLAVRGGAAFLGYAVHYPRLTGSVHISDGSLAIARNMLFELAGATPAEVRLARQKPADPGPWREAFGVTPDFDAEQNAIVFEERDLSRSLKSADAAERASLRSQVASYWAVETPSAAEQVTRVLHASVMFGDATVESVANSLLLHPRTLNRRLRAEGVTFRELRNRARFEVASMLLDGTRMDVTGIALALGYAEPSSLTHAFARWTGMAPSRWRVRPETLSAA